MNWWLERRDASRDCAVRPLTEVERALLHSLAAAGKPTELSGADSLVGKVLEQMGLVFFVRNSASAVITPRGRPLTPGAGVAVKADKFEAPVLG